MPKNIGKTDIKLRYCRNCIETGVNVSGKTLIKESSSKKHFMFTKWKKELKHFL